MHSERRSGFMIFFAYVLTALVVTWPLVLYFNSAITGQPGDNFAFLWNHWQVAQSLFNFSDPYQADAIAWPLLPSLVFHTVTLLPALISSLLQIFLPLVVSFNTVFIAGLSLGAFVMYRFVRYLGASLLVSFLGGLIFAFSPVLVHSAAIGHFNYASAFVLPLYALFFFKTLETPSVRSGCITGLCAAAALYTDSYYAVGLIFLTIFVLIWRFFSDRPRLLATWRALLALVIVAVIAALPLLIKVMSVEAVPIPSLGAVELYSPDIRSLFVPLSDHGVFGNWVASYYKGLGYHASPLYLTFTLLLLAVVGFVFMRKHRLNFRHFGRVFWLGLALCFLVISLGPALYLFGRPWFLLPFVWLHYLPVVNNILVTPHFIIFVIFALTILAVPALERIVKLASTRLLKGAIVLLIIGIYLFEGFSLPLMLSSTRIPELYAELGRDERQYAVLELPFALSTSFYTIGQGNAQTQYYQTLHHKRLLSASISRVPDRYPRFYTAVAGLDYLIFPNTSLTPEATKALAPIARANFEKLGIRYVIIRPDGYSHEQFGNTLAFLEAVYGRKAQRRDGLLVYDLR